MRGRGASAPLGYRLATGPHRGGRFAAPSLGAEGARGSSASASPQNPRRAAGAQEPMRGRGASGPRRALRCAEAWLQGAGRFRTAAGASLRRGLGVEDLVGWGIFCNFVENYFLWW